MTKLQVIGLAVASFCGLSAVPAAAAPAAMNPAVSAETVHVLPVQYYRDYDRDYDHDWRWRERERRRWENEEWRREQRRRMWHRYHDDDY